MTLGVCYDKCIKKNGNKQKMSIITCLELVLLIITTFLYVHQLSFYTDVLSDSMVLLSTFFPLCTEIIPIVLLLLSVILLHKSISNKLFLSALIVGAILPVCLLLIAGNNYTTWETIQWFKMIQKILGTITTILTILIILIIIFANKRKQQYKVACIISIIVLSIRGLALLINTVGLYRGGFYSSLYMYNIVYILHWFVILLYLVRQIKIEKEAIAISPISIEWQLQTIKQKHESGEITQEEYCEQKADLLKKI